MNTQVIDMARSLSRANVEGGGDSIRFFEGNGSYARFRELLAEVAEPAQLRDFLVEPNSFDLLYITFFGLKRLAELVEPNAYLYLRIHDIAIWASTATFEEMHAYLAAAARVAPDDRYVLWAEALAVPVDYPADVAVSRLGELFPGDPLVAEALAGRESYGGALCIGADAHNSLIQKVPNIMNIPGDEIFARLRPKHQP